MNNWQHPKLAKIVTGIIILGIIGIGCFAYDVSQGNHNPIQTFYPPNLQKGYLATAYEITSDGTILSESTFSRQMNIEIKLETTSLSGQNEITVVAHSDDFKKMDVDEFNGMPKTMVLLFPTSIHYPIDLISEFSPNIGYVKIYMNEKAKRYEGSDKILYQFESKGGYFMTHPNNVAEELVQEKQITKHGDGTETVSFQLVGDLQELIYEPTRFPVEPVSTTDNMRMNNVIQAFSILVINIGIIQSRTHIIHGTSWVYRKIKNLDK